MKRIFSAIIVAVFALTMTVSSASAGALTTGGTAGTTIANEIFGTGSDATLIPTGETATAIYTMATTPGAGSAFLITYTLTNGATWGTVLDATNCAHATGGAGAANVSLISGGAVTDSTAVFRVEVTTALEVGDTFTLTFHLDNVDALATAAQTISLGVTLADGLSAVDTADSVVLFTSANGTSEALAATNTSTDIYIDVANASTLFTGSGADYVSTTQISIGTITIADSGAEEDASDGTAWAIGVTDADATATLTLSGNFAAAVAGDFIIDFGGLALSADTITTTTATWNLTAGNLAALVGAGAVNIDMVVDGTTEIEPTTPAATLAVDFATSTYADETVTANLREIAKNGTTVYPGIVIGSDFGYSGGFRIVNRSATAANIYFQVQNFDGSMGTSVAYSGNPLAANATVYIPTDTVLTEGGLSAGSSANGIITVESDLVDIYQISYITSGGFTIVPLTKSNNQSY